MRLDTALTYRGALATLGRHDQPLSELLGRLFGEAGPDNSGLVPIEAALDLFRKGRELTELASSAIDRILPAVQRSSGYKRYELIAAIHTVIAGVALSDAVTAVLEIDDSDESPNFTFDSDSLESSGSASAVAVLRRWPSVEISTPSGSIRFNENIEECIRPHYLKVTQAVWGLILSAPRQAEFRAKVRHADHTEAAVVTRAIATYQNSYSLRAAQIPELFVWLATSGAPLADHVESDIRDILRDQSKSLQALRAILESRSSDENPSLQSILAEINSAYLDESLLAPEAARSSHIVSPSLLEGYVTPHYRSVVCAPSMRVEQEEWWKGQPLRTDLDAFLVDILQSTEGFSRPLVVLGHPGAGKSLLTKVLAASLPAGLFATIRVSLRHVDPNAPVYRQIQQALRDTTHDRVLWPDLLEESADATRVIILDGLDELMQATGVVESSYLEDVAEFQQLELQLKRPTVVLVTSRTVVADRARIPFQSHIIHLEPFNNEQIERWLATWAAKNEARVRSGKVRLLEPAVALRIGDLARQPLLLMLLALYAANPNVPDPGEQLETRALLYRNLLEEFVKREIDKSRAIPPAERERRISDRLLHLGITAFAMFNRGRQYISEEELDRDLDAILGEEVVSKVGSFSDAASRAHRMVGSFYFIHKAEIERRPTMEQSIGAPLQTKRSYEYLHATFADYFMASTVLAIMIDVCEYEALAARVNFREQAARSANSGQAMLEALLSQQSLAKSQPLMTFLYELFCTFGADVRDGILGSLDRAIKASRTGMRVYQYNPRNGDIVERVGCYLANLISLRVVLAGRVQLAELSPSDQEPAKWWESTVRLLRASLDGEGWSGVTQTIELSEGFLLHKNAPGNLSALRQVAPAEAADMREAQLLADAENELRIRLGGMAAAIIGGPRARVASETCEAILALALSRGVGSPHELYRALSDAIAKEPPDDTRRVVEAAMPVLVSCIERDYGSGRPKAPRFVEDFVQRLPSFSTSYSQSSSLNLTVLSLRREVDRRLKGRRSLAELNSVPRYDD
jgi:hypothetical protein